MTQTAHPPSLQFQDLEGVTNWLNNEGKMDDFYFMIVCAYVIDFKMIISVLTILQISFLQGHLYFVMQN